MSRRWSILLGTWFVILLLVPVIAATAGNRSVAIDKKQFQPAPQFSPTRLIDDRYWAAWGRYISDQVPIRDESIRFRRWLKPTGAGKPGQVLVGKDQYRFFPDDLARACQPVFPPERVAQTMALVRKRLQSRGVDVVFVVSPAKTDIMADKLPDHYEFESCAAAGERAFREPLRFGPGTGVIDLWRLLREARRDVDPVFWKYDSHLTGVGRMIMTRAIVDILQPGLFDSSSIHEVVGSRIGDLSQVEGLPVTETVHTQEIRRPDVSIVVDSSTGRVQNEYVEDLHTEGSGRVLPGRTVIIHDSQYAEPSWRDQLSPWFEQATFIHWNLLDGPEARKALKSADHVVIETVERNSERFVQDVPAALDTAFGPS